MEIEDLETFVAVADSGGIGAAARRLGLAKSVVSRRLTRLEEALGTALMVRSTRGAVLSEAGANFRDQAAEICATIETARESLISSGDLRGVLRIAGPASFGSLFGAALADFAGRHPHLEVVARFADQYVDLAGEGFDCAIRVGYLPDSNLVARKIATLPTRLYASPAYLEEHGVPEHPIELRQHATLTPDRSAWIFQRAGETTTFYPQSRFQADNAYVLIEAAVAGLGIMAMGALIADPYVQSGALKIVLPHFTLPDAGIFVVRHAGQFTPRKVRLLSDFLAEQFSDR